MKTYTVRAKRWDRGWELHVEGVGVTQAHRLSSAAEMARSYTAMMRNVAPDSFEVSVVPEIGGELGKAAAAAREMVRKADEAQRSAAARSRMVARQLKDDGLTGRDIAALLQVSPQRVSQLLQAPRRATVPDPAGTSERGGTARRATRTKRKGESTLGRSPAESTSAVDSRSAAVPAKKTTPRRKASDA